jgi:uncharacterized protein YcfL
MRNELQRHVGKDKAKWWVTFIVGLALIACVIALFVKLDRQTSTTTIGGEVYSIGALDDEGEYEKSDTSIYMRKAISTDGLKCELADDAKISYQIFYYDKKGNFISKTDVLTADYNESAPDNATQAKIVITPTADEDGKVSLVEVLGYASQLTVTVDK